MLTDELNDFLTPRQRSQFGLGSLGITVGMMAVLGGALLLAVAMAAYEMHCSATVAARADAEARKTAAARGRMSAPPSHNWQLLEGHKYCTFLSHYKVLPVAELHRLSPPWGQIGLYLYRRWRLDLTLAVSD